VTTVSIPGPRGPTELSLRLASERAELATRLGRAPTATELAAASGIDRDKVIDFFVMGSLHGAPLTDGTSVDQHGPGITDKLDDRNDALDGTGYHAALQPLLAALPDRERTVVVLRFFESLTQTQIAQRVGISPMHVSWLLAKALTQLRDQLQGSADATRVARSRGWFGEKSSPSCRPAPRAHRIQCRGNATAVGE
jgi:RNA polymerase sigma-B factor